MCSGSQEWFIVFCDPKERSHFIQRFLKPGFGHCLAYKESPGGQFLIVVDPFKSWTDVDLVPNNMDSIEQLNRDDVVVKFTANYDNKLRLGHLCSFTCVEVVKSLLGIKSPMIFTPYQLYRRLTNERRKC